jgi:hypothetical protein
VDSADPELEAAAQYLDLPKSRGGDWFEFAGRWSDTGRVHPAFPSPRDTHPIAPVGPICWKFLMAHARWRCASRFSLSEHGPHHYRGSDFLNSNLMSTASAAKSGAAKLLAAIATNSDRIARANPPALVAT